MNATISPRHEVQGAIGLQAADWVVRLRAHDCTAAERAAFEDWLAGGPERVAAWAEAERIHALAAALGGDEMLRAAARRARRDTRAVARRPWRAVAAALAALLVLAVGVFAWLPLEGEAYRTAVGEQRRFMLDDGTLVVLDTDSVLETRFGRRQRLVLLAQGRVQFEVGEDPGRPFLVQAGAATVRDIGTTFQVSRIGEQVEVGLIEGIVEVDAIAASGGLAQVRLAPGERVVVDAADGLGAVQALDRDLALGWPGGELVFRDRRLDHLLAEMNRYAATRIELADPALGELRVSGVFRTDGQPALVAALERGWGLRAERRGGAIVLHGPAEAR